jgi:hypothetical protein
MSCTYDSPLVLTCQKLFLCFLVNVAFLKAFTQDNESVSYITSPLTRGLILATLD